MRARTNTAGACFHQAGGGAAACWLGSGSDGRKTFTPGISGGETEERIRLTFLSCLAGGIVHSRHTETRG